MDRELYPSFRTYDGSGFRTVSITPPKVILSTLVLGTQNTKHPTHAELPTAYGIGPQVLAQTT